MMKDGNSFPFTTMGRSIKTAQLSLPCSVMLKWTKRLLRKTQKHTKMRQQKLSLCRWTDIQSHTQLGMCNPMSDQVLALRIKVQTAQQFGMITLQTPNGIIITSGVPVKSVVGAMDHKGRILEALTLPTLEWKISESPREQFPCNRGLCYLPSLEVFHAYRVLSESTDGARYLMDLPAYEPSKHKDLRAQRAYDASGVNPEMMHCEFKRCTIMVYGKMIKPPIGASRFPRGRR